MYMVALSDRMSSELALQIKLSNDTLLHIARVKLDNGAITELIIGRWSCNVSTPN